MRFPTSLVSRNFPTPLAAVCETLKSHLESCCLDSGGLRQLFYLQYKETLRTLWGRDLLKFQRALHVITNCARQPKIGSLTRANRPKCRGSPFCGSTSFPADSIWYTLSVTKSCVFHTAHSNRAFDAFCPSRQGFRAFAYMKKRARLSSRNPRGI